MGAPIEHDYFIEEGVSHDHGERITIEVGMIGIEGVVGVAPLLGGKNRRPTCGYADCRLTARRTPCTLKATDLGQR
jgi:hypothetical protein